MVVEAGSDTRELEVSLGNPRGITGVKERH